MKVPSASGSVATVSVEPSSLSSFKSSAQPAPNASESAASAAVSELESSENMFRPSFRVSEQSVGERDAARERARLQRSEHRVASVQQVFGEHEGAEAEADVLGDPRVDAGVAPGIDAFVVAVAVGVLIEGP